jgi:hypothetical protein
MKKIISLSVLTALLILSGAAYGECQDQACTFSGGCFKCLNFGGTFCQVMSCQACQGTACPGAQARLDGVKDNKCVAVSDRLFDRLPVSWETTHNDPITQFMQLADSKAPAQLRSFTVTTEAVFRQNIMENRSNKAITAYQMGLIISGQGRAATIQLGAVSKFANPLEPGKTGSVAEQGFPSDVFQNNGGLKRVGIFIASVRFADGTSWHANRKKLKRGAKYPLSKSSRATSIS